MTDTLSPTLDDLAVIVIGRNEGPRLEEGLESLTSQGLRTVYVDSASSDDSVALAKALGVTVIELDATLPLTAAFARNAGVDALAAQGPLPRLLQFIDGDCVLHPDWITAAITAFAAHPDISIVTGWRREKSPLANAFHTMAEVEWHRPAGPIHACGGDMMVTSAAFQAVGGFDPRIIASEDEDFVQRVIKQGGKALRLPHDMTLHDIAMTRFGAWWRRNLRSGNGFAEVGDLHTPHFRPERRRAVVYGVLLPAIAVLGLFMAFVPSLWWIGLPLFGVAALAFLSSILRGWRWLSDFETDADWRIPRGMAMKVAVLFTLSKLPQAFGMIRYYLHRARRAPVRLIEYK